MVTGQGGIDIGNKSADQEEIFGEHVNTTLELQENIKNSFNIRKSHTTSRENINFSDQDQVQSRSSLSLEKKQIVYKEGQEGRKKIEMRYISIQITSFKKQLILMVYCQAISGAGSAAQCQECG